MPPIPTRSARVLVCADAAGEMALSAESMAVPAAALAVLRQLDEASIWRLLLQARSGRSPVNATLHPCNFIQCR